MTFEEFFKKKKINLLTLEQGEPALFSEFRKHFDQMGEKSFDHTKKYWFNKLRLKFPAPAEVTVEKIVIENPLAEQTITESLVESSAPSPAIGFKPKFKAGLTKPVEPVPEKAEETQPEQPAPAPAVGFKPKFKAGLTKPAETTLEEEKIEPVPVENPAPSPTVGFKPRFKAGVTKPAGAMPEEKKDESIPEPATTPTIGFKPRFKAGVTKPAEPQKPDDEPNDQ